MHVAAQLVALRRRYHCAAELLALAFASLPADHEMCDLQDLLDEALQVDFSIQAEDDSPYQAGKELRHRATRAALTRDANRSLPCHPLHPASNDARHRPLTSQVARLLVNMHNQVAAGDFSYVEQMRAAAASAAAQAAAAASQRAPNGVPEADEDSSSDEEGGEASGDAMGAEVGAAVLHRLEHHDRPLPPSLVFTVVPYAFCPLLGNEPAGVASCCAQGMDVDMDAAAATQQQQQQQQQRQEPVLDEDGFQAVQRRRGGRR
jgi:hypothetical protein